MRILHVFRSPVGGLFRHVLDLSREQIARGHEVGLFCDASTGGQRADDALASLRPGLALGVTRVAMRRQAHLSDLAVLSDLNTLCREARPDVIHGHGSKGGLFARIVPARHGETRAVRAYTPHGGSFNYLPGSIQHRFYMRIEAILARRTDAFLFESEYVKRRFVEGVGPPKVPAPVIHNGLTEAEFDLVRHRPDAVDLVYIGELRYAKGIDTLLQALAINRRKGHRMTLLVIGAGPDEATLPDTARELGLGDAITFSRPQPIRAALEAGGIMVIPSKAESLPYVILEAAAAAQPLIATNVGGIPEIFGPFSDQLIPANDPERLADAILRKTAEPATERHDRAIRLRKWVRNGFRMDRMAEGVLAGYEHALRRATGVRHEPRPAASPTHSPSR